MIARLQANENIKRETFRDFNGNNVDKLRREVTEADVLNGVHMKPDITSTNTLHNRQGVTTLQNQSLPLYLKDPA